MKDSDESREDYEKGNEWHIEKSLSYNWKKQRKRFEKGLAGKRVLDAGCGGGRDIGDFIRDGFEVEGLDYAKAPIDFARKKFPQISFYVRDIRHTGLADSAYDGIWACASILNLPKKDVHAVLNEFNRILKNGGKIFISVKEGTGEKIVKEEPGNRRFSFYVLGEIKKMAEDAGFRVGHWQIVPDEMLTGEKTGETKPNWVCVFATKK